MNEETITINVRIIIEVYEKLRQEAFDTRTSMNKILNEALRKYLEEKK